MLVVGELPDRQIDRLLLDVVVGPAFALDDRQGDAVHEQDDVRDVVLLVADPFDLELGRAVVGVVGRISPVDVVDLEALGVALHRLRHVGAETQEVVGLFVLVGRPGGAKRLERLDGVWMAFSVKGRDGL